MLALKRNHRNLDFPWCLSWHITWCQMKNYLPSSRKTFLTATVIYPDDKYKIFLHRNPYIQIACYIGCKEWISKWWMPGPFWRKATWVRQVPSGANTRQMLQTRPVSLFAFKFWIDVLILHGKHAQTLLVVPISIKLLSVASWTSWTWSLP